MTRLFRMTALVAWCLLFLPATAAFAQSVQVDQSDPQALIKTATQQVLDEVRTKAIAPDDIARIQDIVNRDILPYVDFRRTTRLAMGPHWRTTTPEQQAQIEQQFQLLLIHLYSGAIAQLKPDQKIDYPPMRSSPGDTDVVVRTLAQTNSNPLEIDYRLYKTPQGWRLYDLNVLGAWLVQTYRQQFNEKIQQGGVDGLIQFLTARNQELVSGKTQTQ
ncbi:MlaC/ttg2D family ABC transporter substrate-binding protein [Paraburkholderia silvatlantica]|uniref:Phospholipid transport system substrate-binding protein n=1 Tax=Paraburkholderia silvatlantica TaxID=321895 RepID=A0A2U1ALX4_9BURK|nr:ABC transporter substrate-binding protein [Paraburkholderia silvatlantica]MBB2926949.1 phospholipid transport system substrate-binding protein [Paraburkholderia silvatlantica]PVY37429.1 phospholipid transport system substrate-binding protein [Paraburkholderia silvatlantica]PXW42391.1 phospholipid transport system substrate-binding protein [Paraburkholderia silvatlantica]PYE25009.1 phospholipid transport system substrate-binding protein [Paraburkholderia silvatlantica]TDR05203.1 phospholipid